ncbi:MAG: DEAD/DEAH box helicase [Bacteroidetes bacterium MedPE-SWsnd-G2]|nr:MAG: DEAD/DEAH box helicase [Bacteroidetes bacterium MedPE-SWsnd-G2]
MAFKKYLPVLKDSLAQLGIEEETPFQKKTLPIIKSGQNLFGSAKEGSGKTTAIIISCIQKLKGEAFEDAPRALIFVRNKEEALALKEEFLKYTKRTDLRIYTAYDEQNIDHQREEIYYGVDILIGTSSRLTKLFHLNSVNLSQLKLFIVEDAEVAVKTKQIGEIKRLTESIDKCQYVVFANSDDKRLDKLNESFLDNARWIKMA